jgi:hypothetical protein
MHFPAYLFILLMAAHNIGHAMSTQQPIEVKIGESGSYFAGKNSPRLKVDRQPAGLNFYTIDFRTSDLGAVTLAVGSTNTAIDNVMSITGTEDLDFKDEGISEFHINTAITEANLISHDEARLKFANILRNILRAGWTPTIPRSKPRLRGKAMTEYLLRSVKYTTLDASYVPSFDEWMSLPSLTQWAFYNNHTYLNVTFTREHTLTDPRKPGAYLLTFEIKSEAEHFRRYVHGSNRSRWTEFLRKELNILSESRARTEAELRKRGIMIDETYEDPPVPSMNK